MKCFECKKEGLIESREAHRYEESGLPNIVLLNAKVRRCPHCGQKFVSIQAMADLHRAIALALVHKRTRLTPLEIRFLRKSLGWSSVDFARHIDASPSTISRWENVENPQAMGSQAERLLRLLVVLGEKIESYTLNDLTYIDTKEEPDTRLLEMNYKDGHWDYRAAA